MHSVVLDALAVHSSFSQALLKCYTLYVASLFCVVIVTVELDPLPKSHSVTRAVTHPVVGVCPGGWSECKGLRNSTRARDPPITFVQHGRGNNPMGERDRQQPRRVLINESSLQLT